MKQKYLIAKDQKTQKMTIQEFAELDKDVFSLVCEEAYEGKKIKSAVSEGKETLVETLRTPNLYPVSEYAEKIADAVIDLFTQGNQDSVEVEFDDIEALKKEKAAKGGEDENDSVALDELLNDDLDEEENSEASEDKENNEADDSEDPPIDEESLDLFDKEDGDADEEKDE